MNPEDKRPEQLYPSRRNEIAGALVGLTMVGLVVAVFLAALAVGLFYLVTWII